MNAELAADAVLLVGHGTRNEAGQRQFLQLADRLSTAVAPLPIEIAYLELQSPTIAAALTALYREGARHILISPALLFAAGHAKRDLPAAIELARSECPGLALRVAEPLGCHAAVLELAARRVRDAAGEDLSEAALVMVGRGSSDPEAIAHCREFSRQLGNQLGVRQVFAGFLAVAEPGLPLALDQAAASGARQIVVQPHLLFTGEMQESTAAAVAAARVRHPGSQWHLAEVLANDLESKDSLARLSLVRALCDRLSSAC